MANIPIEFFHYKFTTLNHCWQSGESVWDCEVKEEQWREVLMPVNGEVVVVVVGRSEKKKTI